MGENEHEVVAGTTFDEAPEHPMWRIRAALELLAQAKTAMLAWLAEEAQEAESIAMRQYVKATHAAAAAKATAIEDLQTDLAKLRAEVKTLRDELTGGR